MSAPGTVVPSVPIGTIAMWGTSVAPSNWLLCDGEPHSQATYQALFKILGNTFGIATKTDFYVPDLRGRFVRGCNINPPDDKYRDPDSSSRIPWPEGTPNAGNTVGSIQNYAMQSHNHTYEYKVKEESKSNYQIDKAETGGVYHLEVGTSSDFGGNESRPVNLYLNFIICCGPDPSDGDEKSS